MSDDIKTWQERLTDGGYFQTQSQVHFGASARIHARDAEIVDLRAALAAKTEAQQSTDLMAQCMDMVRSELIEAGIIDKTVPPMMVANAVCAHIAGLAAPAMAVEPVAVAYLNEWKKGTRHNLTFKKMSDTDCFKKNATSEYADLVETALGRIVPAATVAVETRESVADALATLCMNGDLPDEMECLADWVQNGTMPAVQQGGEAVNEVVGETPDITMSWLMKLPMPVGTKLFTSPPEAATCDRDAVLEEAAQEADHWQAINTSHKCGTYVAGAIRSMKSKPAAAQTIRMEGDFNTIINGLETGAPWAVICKPGATYEFSAAHPLMDGKSLRAKALLDKVADMPTPPFYDKSGERDALLTRIDEAWSNYERMGEVCSFEGNPMIYASTLEEIAILAATKGAEKP